MEARLGGARLALAATAGRGDARVPRACRLCRPLPTLRVARRCLRRRAISARLLRLDGVGCPGAPASGRSPGNGLPTGLGLGAASAPVEGGVAAGGGVAARGEPSLPPGRRAVPGLPAGAGSAGAVVAVRGNARGGAKRGPARPRVGTRLRSAMRLRPLCIGFRLSLRSTGAHGCGRLGSSRLMMAGRWRLADRCGLACWLLPVGVAWWCGVVSGLRWFLAAGMWSGSPGYGLPHAMSAQRVAQGRPVAKALLPRYRSFRRKRARRPGVGFSLPGSPPGRSPAGRAGPRPSPPRSGHRAPATRSALPPARWQRSGS